MTSCGVLKTSLGKIAIGGARMSDEYTGEERRRDSTGRRADDYLSKADIDKLRATVLRLGRDIERLGIGLDIAAQKIEDYNRRNEQRFLPRQIIFVMISVLAVLMIITGGLSFAAYRARRDAISQSDHMFLVSCEQRRNLEGTLTTILRLADSPAPGDTPELAAQRHRFVTDSIRLLDTSPCHDQLEALKAQPEGYP